MYRQLQRLMLEVDGRQDDWSPESLDVKDLHAGELLASLMQLRSLVHRRLRLTTDLPPVSHALHSHCFNFVLYQSVRTHLSGAICCEGIIGTYRPRVYGHVAPVLHWLHWLSVKQPYSYVFK